MVGLFVLIFVL